VTEDNRNSLKDILAKIQKDKEAETSNSSIHSQITTRHSQTITRHSLEEGNPSLNEDNKSTDSHLHGNDEAVSPSTPELSEEQLKKILEV
jgi:hypothetical protein